MSKIKKALIIFQCLFFIFALNKVAAQQNRVVEVPLPAVSIIIDDMGYHSEHGSRAINLPGKITFSFLPFSPYARQLAELAYQHQQEVMVHMPMEPDNHEYMGPGGLSKDMSEQELAKIVNENLSAIPHAVGFNNHMGSLLTRMDSYMTTVMKAAYRPGLYFIDSRTTSESVALQHAQSAGIYGARRDIFLDHKKSREFVEHQLAKLVERAKKKGTAIAIGHPYKMTLDVLEQWLPRAEENGIKLVSVSKLIQLREQRRFAWQGYLSHSHRAAKN